MKIYELIPEMDTYSSFERKSKVEQGKFEQFYLEPMEMNWLPPKMKHLKSKYEGDFSGILGGTILGVTNKVKEILIREISGNIEFLPLSVEFKETTIFAMNVLEYSMALDEKKSEIIRFPDNRILMITNYVFKDNLTLIPTLFKLDNYKKGTLFCSSRFKEVVGKHNLTGLKFIGVW